MRRLQDGTLVPELDEAVMFCLKTKCPAKWTLIDNETGELYIPNTDSGPYQWRKLSTNENQTK